MIIGAGGFGREIADMLDQYDVSGLHGERAFLRGVVDEGDPDLGRLDRLQVRHLGGTAALASLAGCVYVVPIADPGPRRRLAAMADEAGLVPATLIHRSATLGRDVSVGGGTVIGAGTRITTNVRLGRHVLINQNVTVGHDVVMADYVTVNPLAAVSGEVNLGPEVTIGTNASVIQGLRVGSRAVVGAGAVVTRAVDPGTTVVGVPARAVPRRRGADQ